MLNALVSLILTVFAVQANAKSYKWELVPILPACKAGWFCEKSEMPDQVEKAGIVPRMKDLIQEATKKKAKLSMAFMSFTEPTLFEALCEAGKRGLEIEGFFHSTAGPPKGLGFRLTEECQAPGKTNISMSYMGMPKGGKSGWRLHHNKYMLFDFGAGRVELLFGSANLSSQGLSINFENWNFLSADKKMPLVKDHLCDLEAMRAARQAGVEQNNPDVFRTKLDACTKRSHKIKDAEADLKKEKVVSLFSPDPNDFAHLWLVDQIARVVPGGRIRMAVYFFMHKQIIDALKAAQERGVEVRLLVDDDIYLGKSIPTQQRFWETFLKPSESKFQVRTFDTDEGSFQLQHNKYLVLEGVDKLGETRVFGGAGQFTNAAFKVNYENFYVISDEDVVGAYSRLYDKLWEMASPAP
ncbi:MAG: phospholipase D-like domain-containing protein [Bdellovibrionales bacterium]